jgi:hypothetical protein
LLFHIYLFFIHSIYPNHHIVVILFEEIKEILNETIDEDSTVKL